MSREPRIKLPYGTKVRITDPYNYYCGRVGFINDNNSFDRRTARLLGWIVPPFYYHVDIPTPDDEDIEHCYCEPSGLRVFKDQSR